HRQQRRRTLFPYTTLFRSLASDVAWTRLRRTPGRNPSTGLRTSAPTALASDRSLRTGRLAGSPVRRGPRRRSPADDSSARIPSTKCWAGRYTRRHAAGRTSWGSGPTESGRYYPCRDSDVRVAANDFIGSRGHEFGTRFGEVSCPSSFGSPND